MERIKSVIIALLISYLHIVDLPWYKTAEATPIKVLALTVLFACPLYIMGYIAYSIVGDAFMSIKGEALMLKRTEREIRHLRREADYYAEQGKIRALATKSNEALIEELFGEERS